MSNLIFTRLLNQQLAAPQFNSPMKIVSGNLEKSITTYLLVSKEIAKQ